jgi:hypothetical protein
MPCAIGPPEGGRRTTPPEVAEERGRQLRIALGVIADLERRLADMQRANEARDWAVTP